MEFETSYHDITAIDPINVIEDRVRNLTVTTDKKIQDVINETNSKIKNTADEADIKLREAIKAYDAEFQPIKIVVGAHPKKRSKNKFIQWFLIKLFGYELEYKTVMAKTVVIKPEDYPFYDEDIEITF